MNTNDGRPSAAANIGVKPVSNEHANDMREAGGANEEGGGQLTLPLSRGMHVMRAAEASETNEQNPEAAGEAVAVTAESSEVDAPLGQRLRAAREHAGWTQADVAARLKLPVNLIGRLESGDYEGLNQGVFLRGYLGSYARLVGVPDALVTRVAAAHTEPVPLVATGTISRSRYLFDRYSVSATYLVLTAIIVVPAVWLATHGGLEQNLARTTPLDPPASTVSVPLRAAAQESTANTAAQDIAAAGSTTTQTADSPPVAPPAVAEQAPVIASMTPFATPAPASTPAATAASSEATSASAAGGSGAHVVQLKLSQQSWVEILGSDGRKLEYGILGGGSDRSYRSDGPVTVRLGNAQGAEVRSDGSLVDLTPFQRGNVAHVKLFGSNGSGASRVE
ncbi:MAG: RodZ domain-containing protein [Dokdonella sp.]